MTPTEQALAEMLTENTGTHFLDSGGAYGRHWQRNRGRKFSDELTSTLTARYGYLEVTHNVYHWLAERLDLDEEATELFERFSERSDESYLYDMQEFPAYHAKHFPSWAEPCEHCEDGVVSEDGEPVYCEHCEGSGVIPDEVREAAGIYGEGEPIVVNTYNGEDLLSQTLQYVYYTIDREEYVALSIHGGCDVRGGYTRPKVFTVGEELAIFDNARASIYCDRCEQHWSTDDGCHWYHNGCCGAGCGKQLDEYEMVSLDDGGKWEEGKLCHKGDCVFCPDCGRKLGASPW